MSYSRLSLLLLPQIVKINMKSLRMEPTSETIFVWDDNYHVQIIRNFYHIERWEKEWKRTKEKHTFPIESHRIKIMLARRKTKRLGAKQKQMKKNVSTLSYERREDRERKKTLQSNKQERFEQMNRKTKYTAHFWSDKSKAKREPKHWVLYEIIYLRIKPRW